MKAAEEYGYQNALRQIVSKFKKSRYSHNGNSKIMQRLRMKKGVQSFLFRTVTGGGGHRSFVM